MTDGERTTKTELRDVTFLFKIKKILSPSWRYELLSYLCIMFICCIILTYHKVLLCLTSKGCLLKTVKQLLDVTNKITGNFDASLSISSFYGT